MKRLALATSALLCLAACGEREEGLRFTLGLSHAPTSSRSVAVEGSARTFTTAGGEHVTLTRGFVTLGSVELKPGGMHLMLLGLKQPLQPGQSVPLTLRFEKAGEVPVQLQVQGTGAPAQDAGHDHGAGHGHDHGASHTH